jgi:hypothetical protein
VAQTNTTCMINLSSMTTSETAAYKCLFQETSAAQAAFRPSYAAALRATAKA